LVKPTSGLPPLLVGELLARLKPCPSRSRPSRNHYRCPVITRQRLNPWSASALLI